MSFITKADLQTRFYEENIDKITRGDDNKVITAISEAESQASRYLSRFNISAIYASSGTDREKYADLIGYIKDLAKWRLVNLCNAGVDLELAKTAYDDAISELGKIQKGSAVPEDWPLKADVPGVETGSFQITSRPKRGNYY